MLAALSRISTIAELAATYEIHPSQITKWKAQLHNGATNIFGDKRKKENCTQERMMENDWLKSILENQKIQISINGRGRALKSSAKGDYTILPYSRTKIVWTKGTTLSKYKFMNKYVIFFIIAVITIIITALSFKNYLPFNVPYLMGSSEYNFFPKDIAEKHKVTISAVDTIITKEHLGGVTSQSENFDLEVYLKTLQVGVFPYLTKTDPLEKNVQLLIDDISLYIRQDFNP